MEVLEPLVQLSASDLAAQEHLLHEQRDRLHVVQLFGSDLVHAELVLVRPHPAEEGL